MIRCRARHLADDRLDALFERALEAGLPALRRSLVDGLPARVRFHLLTKSQPAAQMRADLRALNRHRQPRHLRTWLMAARQLNADAALHGHVDRCLAELGATPLPRCWPLWVVSVALVGAAVGFFALGRSEPEPVPEPEPAPATPPDSPWVQVPAGDAYVDGARVEVGALWVQRTELTQADWVCGLGKTCTVNEADVAAPNPAYFRLCSVALACPVERVSWYEAVDYANRLSDQQGRRRCYAVSGCSGKPGLGCRDAIECEGDFRCAQVTPVADCDGFRLPTRAEWARFAGDGAETPLWPPHQLDPRGPYDAPALGAVAWYGGNSEARYAGAHGCVDAPLQLAMAQCGPQPVGGKPANPLGLHDVLGNVAEWTQDGDAAARLAVGGGWAAGHREATLHAKPAALRPTHRAFDLGFRLVTTRAPD